MQSPLLADWLQFAVQIWQGTFWPSPDSCFILLLPMLELNSNMQKTLRLFTIFLAVRSSAAFSYYFAICFSEKCSRYSAVKWDVGVLASSSALVHCSRALFGMRWLRQGDTWWLRSHSFEMGTLQKFQKLIEVQQRFEVKVIVSFPTMSKFPAVDKAPVMD